MMSSRDKQLRDGKMLYNLFQYLFYITFVLMLELMILYHDNYFLLQLVLIA